MKKKKLSLFDIILFFIALSFIVTFMKFAIICIVIYVVFRFIIFIVKSNSENTPSNTIFQSNINYDDMDGYQFEQFCAEIMKYNGYKKVSVTQGSGDNGVDVIAYKDNLKYVIQCKCYSSNIGNKAVQEVFTGKQMYNADIAIVMTNRYFTQSAIQTAKSTNVLLWDRDKLNTLIPQTNTNSNFSFQQSSDTQHSEKEDLHVISNNNTSNHKKGELKMYDKNKGIFPSGTYEVGEDIEIGKYLLTSKQGRPGEISVYPSYEDYKNDTNLMTYNSFEGDYHLSLRENGLFITLDYADMKKI